MITFLCEYKTSCFCRLSYHQRIREILPDSFSCFIPAKPEPDYKYAKEGAGKETKLFCTVFLLALPSIFFRNVGPSSLGSSCFSFVIKNRNCACMIH